MARFHPLTVTAIQQETRDAVVVTLAPSEADTDKFAFVQGQYLTFRRSFDNEEVRRSYSICAGLDDGALQVGIKRVEGGCFSSWANESLSVGDTVEAMPPMGNFHAPLDAGSTRHYLLVAGGSGITPVLSLVRTLMVREPNARVTLLYGNRSVNTIMFRETIEDLKNVYLGRFSVIHILEHDAQDVELFSGRVDNHKCAALFDTLIRVVDLDMAFICGPGPMMLAVADALRAEGMTEDRIKFELFTSAQPGRASSRPTPPKSAVGEGAALQIILDGTARSVEIAKAGMTVLEAALAANIEAPYACKAGVCSTCRARVLEGEVEMTANFALEDYELKRGYVLTCQAHPITPKVVIDYDQ
jgi:ring-1,2-phenylacetyl-CoA epoxidase subunit PaaE